MSRQRKFPPIPIRLDGATTTATVAKLKRTMKKAAAVRPLRQQCRNLMSRIVSIYAAEVAAEEVGNTGGGRAVGAESQCPVGLLYGRVQSGKTNAMVLSAAIAIDNGFRTIVVFTSDVIDLVEQTRRRFESSLDGPLVYSSDQHVRWTVDEPHVRQHMPQHGLVVVCAKNPKRVKALLKFLDAVGAYDVPALIMDDEADQATPDTKLRKRSKAGETTATIRPSRIHSLAFGNDPQVVSVRSKLRHNFFLQVTATPQALFLQPDAGQMRPELKFLLEPGTGYLGGDFYFDRKKVADGEVPLAYVDPSEPVQLEGVETPEGLKKAVSYFLLANATMRKKGVGDGTGRMSMLLHTSVKVTEHSNLQRKLDQYLSSLHSDPASNDMIWQKAYAELARSVRRLPQLDELKTAVLQSLHLRRIAAVNYRTGRINYGPAANFIIGGNILGRGLTIENLLVTYYLRTAGVTQMDTMHQHARMYGYREAEREYLRVFLTKNVAQRFNHIHESEKTMRELIRAEETDPIPVPLGDGLRATRSAVVDPNAVGMIFKGSQVYPILPVHDLPELAAITAGLDEQIAEAFGGQIVERQYLEITVTELIRLIEQVPVHESEPGSWNFAALRATLISLESVERSSRALLYVRKMNRQGPELESGALFGGEQRDARGKNCPVLFMIKETGSIRKGWSDVPFWYPTISFPRKMTSRIFHKQPVPV